MGGCSLTRASHHTLTRHSTSPHVRLVQSVQCYCCPHTCMSVCVYSLSAVARPCTHHHIITSVWGEEGLAHRRWGEEGLAHRRRANTKLTHLQSLTRSTSISVCCGQGSNADQLRWYMHDAGRSGHTILVYLWLGTGSLAGIRTAWPTRPSQVWHPLSPTLHSTTDIRSDIDACI